MGFGEKEILAASIGALVGSIVVLVGTWFREYLRDRKKRIGLLFVLSNEMVLAYQRTVELYRQVLLPNERGEVELTKGTIFELTDYQSISDLASVGCESLVLARLTRLKHGYFQMRRHLDEGSLWTTKIDPHLQLKRFYEPAAKKDPHGPSTFRDLLVQHSDAAEEAKVLARHCLGNALVFVSEAPQWNDEQRRDAKVTDETLRTIEEDTGRLLEYSSSQARLVLWRDKHLLNLSKTYLGARKRRLEYEARFRGFEARSGSVQMPT